VGGVVNPSGKRGTKAAQNGKKRHGKTNNPRVISLAEMERHKELPINKVSETRWIAMLFLALFICQELKHYILIDM